MNQLCATCNVCSFMPEQARERILYLGPSAQKKAPILVIDDVWHIDVYDTGLDQMGLIAPLGLTDYTMTIRCDLNSPIDSDQLKEAISHCAVWTNSLASDRSIIIATPHGMRQLRVAEKYQEPGVLFKSKTWGLMLCIEPLTTIGGTERDSYKAKVNRLIKAAGLHE